MTMSGYGWLAGSALLTALIGSAACAEPVDPTGLERCRGITDRLGRLVCFDALAAGKTLPTATASGASTATAPTAPAAPTYRPMTLVDLQVDAAEMRGHRVEVTGVLQQVGEMVMLKDTLFSATGLFVEVTSVPREERRRMLQLCGQGCTAVVRGIGATVMMNPGVKAERVEIP